MSVGRILAWLSLLIAGMGLAARFLPVVNHAVLVFSALSTYIIAGATLLAVSVLLMRRQRAAVATLVVAAVAFVSVELPLFLGPERPPEPSVTVRVMTVNVSEGGADPGSLATLARNSADVLAIQELTPAFATRIDLDAEFPYQVLDAHPGANGIGMWSRFPIAGQRRLLGFPLGAFSATVRVPGAAADPVFLVAHVVGPWPQPIDDWRNEIGRLRRVMSDLAATAGSAAVIVAGDFNATRAMASFRRLLDGGYRDAAEQAGSGPKPTYPADAPVPPMIGIDHIIIRNGSATDVRTDRISGTDHLGLSATVHVGG